MGPTHSIGMSMRSFKTAFKRKGDNLTMEQNRNSKVVAKGADFKAAVGATEGGMEIKDINRVTNFKEIISSKATTMVTTTDHTRVIIREDPGDKDKDNGGINILPGDEVNICKGMNLIKI